MKINWKLRFKNPVTLISLLTLVVELVYQIFAILGAVPSVPETQVVQVLTIFVNLLATMGILTDPTTKGLSDSERAMGYEEPN